MITRAQRQRNAALMVDLSSNNDPNPDLRAHRAAGYRWIGIKATEGNGYVNPNYERLVTEAHHHGFRVVHYHFGVAAVGGITQAQHFLKTIVSNLHRKDAVAYDCEGQPAIYRQWRTGEAKTVAAAFMAYLDLHGPRVGRLRRRGYWRFIYGPAGFISSNNVRHFRGWWLWIANYGGAPTPATGWRRWTIWQYTDRGTAVGIHTPVDMSHLRFPAVPPWRPKPKPIKRKKTR